jgi:hypothetical protein
MLLVIVLCLHGDSVKDYLPPRVEQVRQVARARLLVLGVREGNSQKGVRDLMGRPKGWTVSVRGFGVFATDEWVLAGVFVHYIGKSASNGNPRGLYVEKVSIHPLYSVLVRLLQ